MTSDICVYGFAVVDILFNTVPVPVLIGTMTSKAEYLKRYVSQESAVKKKKEKRPVGDKSR